MRLLGITVAGALALSGCAGTGRLMSYGTDMADALVRMGPAAFSVYVHPADDTLMLQRRMSQTSNSDGPALITIAAQTFLDPVGCTAGSATPLAPGTWEVPFTCPAAVDIRALAQQQRAALRAGTPIHP